MQDYARYVNSIQRENKQYIGKLKNAKKEYECMKTKLETFRDKISIDLMVPVANNAQLAFLEGTAVHTNELLVALGSNYFAKMTAKDAIEFCNRKCTVIEQRISEYETQNKMLIERSSLLNSQMLSETEIVEEYKEEQEMMWRQKHREHIKNMKQQEAEERRKLNEKPDDYYFSRLDELELEESLSELNTGS